MQVAVTPNKKTCRLNSGANSTQPGQQPRANSSSLSRQPPGKGGRAGHTCQVGCWRPPASHTAAKATQGWLAMPSNLLRMLRVLGGDLSVCVAGVGGDFTGQSSELAEVSMWLKASANQSVLGNRWQRTGVPQWCFLIPRSLW